MAADQRRKRLNGASLVSYDSKEQHRAKRKNLGLIQIDLRMRSHIAVEWDGNQKRVVSKREQIGISWRQMKPFVNFVSNDHKVLADVLTIPPEIFDLDDLNEVLSYEVWMSHLSENERNLLMNFLPHGLEPYQAVEELFAGNNFHFGNPFFKWSASLCLGDVHPDVIVHREQHLKSEKKSYYTQLHNYHNDMIGFLVKLKERWQSCKDQEKEIVQKIWRSKNVEKRVPSNVTESRVYDYDGNFTVTSESCSWDAEENECSSDNQILSLRKDDKLQRRVLEIGIGKSISTNSMVSSDDMLNVGERIKKGDKLPKRNIYSSDGGKYMSCIKISKQQHELFMSMKQSSRIIQSRSLNQVLGNLDNIHVQPYDIFIKEEQKKLYEHWLQLANKALPAAYANWMERQRERHAMRSSLVAEVKDKSNPPLEEEDIVSTGSEIQDKDVNNISSVDNPGDQDEGNMRSEGELQDPDEDNMRSESKLQDYNEDNVSEGNVQNVQSCWNDNEVYVSRSLENHSPSLENQSPQDSYVSGSNEFNPMCTKLKKNIVSPKSDDSSPNKVDYSRNRNTREVSVNQGPPFSSSRDVWQAVDMPPSLYNSCLTHEYTAQGLSIENSQVNEEDRTCLIDLETDLRQQATDKELLQRQLDDATFSSFPSQHRSDLIQSLFKGEGVLSYHHEQKGSELDFQASNNVITGEGQFSSHFKEPLQTSLTLDQGQRRAGEIYMPENMSENIYSNEGRYLAHKQERLVPREETLGAVNMTDWTDNTAHVAPPSQSQLSTGDFSGHHWFPEDHQVRGGWNGSDCSSLSSHNLGSAMNSDQSLFSILSQCNQLCPGGSYDSIRNTDQFLAQRAYGVVDASTSRTNAVAPHASHPLEYFSGRDMPSGLVPDDMAWMNLPHQNSAIHDQMGKPYLRSWDR